MSTTTHPPFDGETYEDLRDGDRLAGLLTRVRDLMEDGSWRTLRSLAIATGGSEASVSARLRDLRKPKFGGRTVERRYLSAGVWAYRLVPAEAVAA